MTKGRQKREDVESIVFLRPSEESVSRKKDLLNAVNR